jgi:predicted metal-dependent phosphoesterase TrpH
LRYDLHTHTEASDGVLSPAALVAAARRANLDGIAVTDHDTVNGVAPAIAAGAERDLEVVAGVELSIQVGDEDVHVLGYFIDHENPQLVGVLDGIVAMRRDRAAEMVRLLNGLGRAIAMEDVLAEAGDGAPGRPHVAKALVGRGEVGSLEEAFDRFIGNGGPAYVPKSQMDAERGFSLFARHGAVPVLAHPGLVDYASLLPGFLELGLQGLEVDHPKHDLPERAALRALCREHGLVATGGSDFHGPGAPHRGLGCCGVSGAALAELRARRPSGAA